MSSVHRVLYLMSLYMTVLISRCEQVSLQEIGTMGSFLMCEEPVAMCFSLFLFSLYQKSRRPVAASFSRLEGKVACNDLH